MQEQGELNVFLQNSYLLKTGAIENRNLNHPWRGGWHFASVSFIAAANVATLPANVG